jgi:hypothetical protein
MFRITFQKKFYYFFTEESRQIRYPFPLNNAWKDRVMDVAANVIPRTRSRPTTTDNNIMMASAVNTEGTGGNKESIEESSPNKQRRIVDNLEIVEASCTTRSYWPCSPEAYQVLRPKKQGQVMMILILKLQESYCFKVCTRKKIIGGMM